jgi:hypothetical protein
LILREENKVWKVENWVLRRIFGIKKEVNE